MTLDLQPIKQQLASITQGEWHWDGNVWRYDPENEAPWLIGGSDIVVLGGSIECASEANAKFIAAAPGLVRELVERVEELEDVLRSAKDAADNGLGVVDDDDSVCMEIGWLDDAKKLLKP